GEVGERNRSAPNTLVAVRYPRVEVGQIVGGAPIAAVNQAGIVLYRRVGRALQDLERRLVRPVQPYAVGNFVGAIRAVTVYVIMAVVMNDGGSAAAPGVIEALRLVASGLHDLQLNKAVQVVLLDEWQQVSEPSAVYPLEVFRRPVWVRVTAA